DGGGDAGIVPEGVAIGRQTSRGWTFGRRICGPDAADPLHGVEDVRVGAAAAEIPCDRRADLIAVGLRVRVQQHLAGHDHSRGAVAALEGIRFDERLLDCREPSVRREALDRRDLAAPDLVGQSQAGADRLSVDEHGAGAAGAPAANGLRTRHAEPIPQRADQRDAGLDRELLDGAVDLELEGDRSRSDGPGLGRDDLRPGADRDRADEGAANQIPTCETALEFVVAHELTSLPDHTSGAAEGSAFATSRGPGAATRARDRTWARGGSRPLAS